MYELRVYPSAEKAAANLAQKILEISRKAIQKNGRSVWALSGGSSILKFYDALNTEPDPGPDFWNRLVVCWVDERHVPREHSDSNFGNALRYFWKKREGTTLVTVPWYRDPELSAKGYQDNLTDHGIADGDAIDVILLGMGADGHTASLFPNSKTLEVQNSTIAPYINKKKGSNRITMTYPMINRCRNIEVFAYGEEKGTTFGKVLRDKNKQKYPVFGIEPEKSTFFVDNAFYSRASAVEEEYQR